MASPLSAAGAYNAVQRIVSADSSAGFVTPANVGGENGTNFATILKEAIGSVQEAGRKSDVQSVAMVNGKSNMVDVVTAVAETEVAIDAVVAVRDKVIAAYEEIMKMPI
jgi:flagellar hook-basal body complex protein FliE